MYHDVVGPDGGTEGRRPDIYAVTPEAFRQQLDRIGELVGSPLQRAEAPSSAAGPWMAPLETPENQGCCRYVRIATPGGITVVSTSARVICSAPSSKKLLPWPSTTG